MAKHIIFTEKEAFEDTESAEVMKYVHVLNDTHMGGEFTLCGIAFDGDGYGSNAEPSKETDEKITCPECIKLIKFCKSIKASEMKIPK